MKKTFACIVLLVVVVFAVPLLAEESSTPTTGVYVFENVRVLPMTGGPAIENARVVVRGDKIVTVETMDDKARPAGAMVIDGSGKTLTPGLADMHTHYWPEIGPLYIANGITTVRNLWGSAESAGWDRDAKRGVTVAPHHYYSGPLMDGPEPIWGDGSVRIASVEQVVGAIEAQRAVGFKAVKLYEGLTPEIYRAAVAAAKEREMQVWTHTPQGLTYADVIELGVDSVEHFNNVQDLLVPDGMEIGRGEEGFQTAWSEAVPEKMTVLAEQTASAGVWNAPTYSVMMQQIENQTDTKAFFDRPELAYVSPQTVGWWRGRALPEDSKVWELAPTAALKFRMMIKALYDAGAPLLIGTDSPNPFTVPAFAIHDELQAFVDSGIPVADVLRIATADAARFFDEEGQWGVIAPGARADLVLVAADPREELETYRRPIGVMMNGHWYDRDEMERGLALIKAEVERAKAEAASSQ